MINKNRRSRQQIFFDWRRFYCCLLTATVILTTKTLLLLIFVNIILTLIPLLVLHGISLSAFRILTFLLSLDFKVTSLIKWSAQLKINPFYGMLSGFEVGDVAPYWCMGFALRIRPEKAYFKNGIILLLLYTLLGVEIVMSVSHVYFYWFQIIFTFQCSFSCAEYNHSRFREIICHYIYKYINIPAK